MIRRLLLVLVCAALLTGAAGAQEMNKELVRLQVVAEDDSSGAQELKRALRNECLRCAEICIGDAGSAQEAYMRLEAHLDDFQSACEARARKMGCEAQIRAEAGVFAFPDRLYGGVLVPAGEYRALRVTIGEGAGHNWWCVLYPTLCYINEEDAAGGVLCNSSVLAWLKEKLGGAV